MNEKPEYVTDALEMIGILNQPRKIVTEVSGFIPMFEAVINRYKDHTRAAVHGAMWRFCQMEDGVCKASLSTIGRLIGVDAATVQRHAEVLVQDGYFVDLTPDLKNRPHVYADTGKVVMVGSLQARVAQRNVSIAQRNVSIAQRNVSIAESQLNKDFNKDSIKSGVPPKEWGPDWAVAAGASSEQVADTLEDGVARRARMVDAANLLATGFGVNAPEAYNLALAFMEEMNIVIPEGQVKGQRKAVREMVEWGVTAEHVRRAVQHLKSINFAIADLHSVVRVAKDFKNKESAEPAEDSWDYVLNHGKKAHAL